MVTTTIARVRASLQQSPIDSLLLLVLALALLPGVGLALLDLIPLPAQLDFATYYLAAQALNTGLSPYDRSVLAALAEEQGGIVHAAYFYPPAFAALLRPLALLPFSVANVIWLCLNVLCYVIGVLLIIQLLELPARWRTPLLAASMLVPALHHTLELGQINTVLLASISGATLILSKGSRNGLGGGLLGVAGGIKLFPLGLVLPLLAHRRWRAIAGAIIGLALFTLIGIVAGGGPATSVVWLTEVLPGIVGGFSSPNNQSVLAAALRLGLPTDVTPIGLFGAPPQLTVQPLVNAPLLLRGVGIVLCTLIVVVTIVVLGRRWRRGEQAAQLPIELATLLALTLLITPIVWYHYYVLLLLPIGVGLRGGWHKPTIRRLILAGCVLIAIQRYWRITVLLGSPLMLSLGTFGALAIWWALIRLLLPADPSKAA